MPQRGRTPEENERAPDRSAPTRPDHRRRAWVTRKERRHPREVHLPSSGGRESSPQGEAWAIHLTELHRPSPREEKRSTWRHPSPGRDQTTRPGVMTPRHEPEAGHPREESRPLTRWRVTCHHPEGDPSRRRSFTCHHPERRREARDTTHHSAGTVPPGRAPEHQPREERHVPSPHRAVPPGELHVPFRGGRGAITPGRFTCHQAEGRTEARRTTPGPAGTVPPGRAPEARPSARRPNWGESRAVPREEERTSTRHEHRACPPRHLNPPSPQGASPAITPRGEGKHAAPLRARRRPCRKAGRRTPGAPRERQAQSPESPPTRLASRRAEEAAPARHTHPAPAATVPPGREREASSAERTPHPGRQPPHREGRSESPEVSSSGAHPRPRPKHPRATPRRQPQIPTNSPHHHQTNKASKNPPKNPAPKTKTNKPHPPARKKIGNQRGRSGI